MYVIHTYIYHQLSIHSHNPKNNQKYFKIIHHFYKIIGYLNICTCMFDLRNDLTNLVVFISSVLVPLYT